MSQLENLVEIIPKFEGQTRGFFTQNCVTWVGNWTSIFQNCLIPWGNPALYPQGEITDRCIIWTILVRVNSWCSNTMLCLETPGGKHMVEVHCITNIRFYVGIILSMISVSGIYLSCDKEGCEFKTFYHRVLVQHKKKHDGLKQLVCEQCSYSTAEVGTNYSFSCKCDWQSPLKNG